MTSRPEGKNTRSIAILMIAVLALVSAILVGCGGTADSTVEPATTPAQTTDAAGEGGGQPRMVPLKRPMTP